MGSHLYHFLSGLKGHAASALSTKNMFSRPKYVDYSNRSNTSQFLPPVAGPQKKKKKYNYCTLNVNLLLTVAVLMLSRYWDSWPEGCCGSCLFPGLLCRPSFRCAFSPEWCGAGLGASRHSTCP